MKGSYARFKDFSIPNVLSMFRLVLIPVFIAVFFSPIKNRELIAACILVVSGLTDLLDGMIARKFNMITDLGKLLDPLADKLTQATVCICLVIENVALFWFLILFIVKESLMIAGGANMLHKSRTILPSKWYGKLATVVFYVVMISIIAFGLNQRISEVLILITLGFMLFAFAMYLRIYLNLTSKKEEKTENRARSSVH